MLMAAMMQKTIHCPVVIDIWSVADQSTVVKWYPQYATKTATSMPTQDKPMSNSSS